MSRLTRDEASSLLAVREIERSPALGALLVLEDPRLDVAEAGRRTGAVIHRWSRFDEGAEWPAGGFTRVAIRLPRARQEFEMLVHMAAGALPAGGEVLVYGANDEGVKSVAGRLDPWFEQPTVLATGGHARLIGAVRAETGDPRVGFGAWRVEWDVDLPWGVRRWVSYPGVFAHGSLDDGTALLLEHLPRTAPGDRALDYGAGTGYLAAGLLHANPGSLVIALEVDALAAAAARENVPGSEVVVGRGWDALSDPTPFDVVVANPPYHRGKVETLAEIDGFVAGAAQRIRRGGVLRCVVQRRLPFSERADAAGLRKVRVVADQGPYRVWEASV